jgi:hypothetical protein
MVHRDLHKAPRVRAVLDFLGELLTPPRPKGSRSKTTPER